MQGSKINSILTIEYMCKEKENHFFLLRIYFISEKWNYRLEDLSNHSWPVLKESNKKRMTNYFIITILGLFISQYFISYIYMECMYTYLIKTPTLTHLYTKQISLLKICVATDMFF